MTQTEQVHTSIEAAYDAINHAKGGELHTWRTPDGLFTAQMDSASRNTPFKTEYHVTTPKGTVFLREFAEMRALVTLSFLTPTAGQIAGQRVTAKRAVSLIEGGQDLLSRVLGFAAQVPMLEKPGHVQMLDLFRGHLYGVLDGMGVALDFDGVDAVARHFLGWTTENLGDAPE